MLYSIGHILVCTSISLFHVVYLAPRNLGGAVDCIPTSLLCVALYKTEGIRLQYYRTRSG
jgi:hypothetical protein